MDVMRYLANVEDIQEIQISVEELIDHYFNSKYDVEIMWENEDLHGDTLTITNSNLSGPAENVNFILEEFAIDQDIE